VVASGSPPLYYQWRFNGARIADASLSSYTRNNVQPSDAGSYSVVITQRGGLDQQQPSVLTVILPARITVQPADVTVSMGADAQFTVTATEPRR